MPLCKSNYNKALFNSKKKITLDQSYQEYLNKFMEEENILIPRKMNERKILLNEYKNNNCNFEEKLDIKLIIENIDKLIKKHKNDKKQYYLDNYNIIFEYFKNKKELSNCVKNKSDIENFFKVNSDSNEKIEKSINNIEKYFENINFSNSNINEYTFDNNICQLCKKGELISIDNEGILVCNKCFNSSKYLIEFEKPTYKEPPKEVTFYAYKRINHFREIIAQFQAKETTQIPDEIIYNIKLQISKERLQISNLTNKNLKEVLKKLKYNKYYEHIPFIKDKLGIRPPIMSPELEDTLCNLFTDTQIPYAKFCPQDRVNFLNYYYTIYKLCELLGQTQFLPFFPMLKDREKRIEQDEIWKKICNELNWDFIPTI
jgi:hypothetical protein